MPKCFSNPTGRGFITRNANKLIDAYARGYNRAIDDAVEVAERLHKLDYDMGAQIALAIRALKQKDDASGGG